MADYARAAGVFLAIERLEADVAARLEALARERSSAAAFVASVAADRARRRRERARLARRLRVTMEAVAQPPASSADLRGLRESQQALVHVHAEGLPALGDALVVDALARHMVALAAQLTVIDLWIEAEETGD